MVVQAPSTDWKTWYDLYLDSEKRTKELEVELKSARAKYDLYKAYAERTCQKLALKGNKFNKRIKELEVRLENQDTENQKLKHLLARCNGQFENIPAYLISTLLIKDIERALKG